MTLRNLKQALKHNISSKYVINMMNIGEPDAFECIFMLQINGAEEMLWIIIIIIFR